MAEPAGKDVTTILVAGHESAEGADVRYLEQARNRWFVTPIGRPLHNLLTRHLASGDGPIVVVPMTMGRNPTLVADTAKTVQWLAAGAPERLALAAPFGSPDHLISWLRLAATGIRSRSSDAAMVIQAPSSDPFDEAELHRVAHLVRTHGAGNVVEVATTHTDDDLVDVLQRLRRLGHPHAVVVPAGFRRESPVPLDDSRFTGCEFYGPLMSEQAAIRIIDARIRDAVHELAHGRTGVESGLMADHGHGYAHSHAFDDSPDSAHGHGHGHGHGQEHAHRSRPGDDPDTEHSHRHPATASSH